MRKLFVTLFVLTPLLASCQPGTNLPTTTGSSSSNTATESSSSETGKDILQDVESSYLPGTWAAAQNETYPLHLETGDNRLPQAHSIQATQWGINRNDLDTFMKGKGWTNEIKFDADGVTGSQWGYAKQEDATTQYLIVYQGSTGCTPHVNAPGVDCTGHFTKVTLTDPVPAFTQSRASSAASAGWRSYRNGNDNFTVSLPSNWEIHLQNKPELLPSTFSNLTGTKFQDPNTQAFVFVAISPTCPDISINSSETVNTNLNGRTFSATTYADGAAGSVGDEAYYTSSLGTGRCAFISSFYFHTTGEAYDEPKRSQVKADIAQEKAVIAQIVNSLTFE
jgi:hypothetical protein